MLNLEDDDFIESIETVDFTVLVKSNALPIG